MVEASGMVMIGSSSSFRIYMKPTKDMVEAWGLPKNGEKECKGKSESKGNGEDMDGDGGFLEYISREW
ncbi:12265_t:CDS:2 [Funneliformis caledonium]|uniref:12265_t:CDS:1 n=1 Tax=Funneliformis caledonium TaxID=1117310 RepID=A0A9N9G076_9GLOM|nr:12265_t:CDS:2 [Funneliformis caledonium]